MVTPQIARFLPHALAVRPMPTAADPLAQLLRDIERELAGMGEGEEWEEGAVAEGVPAQPVAGEDAAWPEAELAADLAAGGRGRIRIRGANR